MLPLGDKSYNESPFAQWQRARQGLICHGWELISERKTEKEMHKDCDKTV